MDQVVVQGLLDRVEALAKQVEEQRAEIDRLKAAVHPTDAATDETVDGSEPGTSRRNLLMAGAGMAAAVVAGNTDSARADFRATSIADASNAYGGLGAAGGNPGAVLPALGATTHGLIGVAEAGSLAPTRTSGVLGTSRISVGVQALSVSGFGVYARATSGTGVLGTSINRQGVRGECVTALGAVDRVGVPAAGVLGISNKSNGVTGVATGATGAGVLAVSRNPNAPALMAQAANASAPAAVVTGATTLNGTVTANGAMTVNGDLAVTGAKSAAIPHPDGTHRLVYCVEAPEAWLEDFGEGSVANGKGEVVFDPDFAALCEPGRFHVFIAEYGDFRLHVSRRDGVGFTVEADSALATLKGQSPAALSGTFSYRVVARRKDRPGVRLQHFSVPRMEAG